MTLGIVIQFASTNILWSTLICEIIISSSSSCIANTTVLDCIHTLPQLLGVYTG